MSLTVPTTSGRALSAAAVALLRVLLLLELTCGFSHLAYYFANIFANWQAWLSTLTTSASHGEVSNGAIWLQTLWPNCMSSLAASAYGAAWFQERSVYPHYDVTVSVRDKALTLGASMGDRGTIITCAKQLKAELTRSG